MASRIIHRNKQGPAGPNELTTSTATDITGLLKGTGSNVAQAVEATDYDAPATVQGKADAAQAAAEATAAADATTKADAAQAAAQATAAADATTKADAAQAAAEATAAADATTKADAAQAAAEATAAADATTKADAAEAAAIAAVDTDSADDHSIPANAGKYVRSQSSGQIAAQSLRAGSATQAGGWIMGDGAGGFTTVTPGSSGGATPVVGLPGEGGTTMSPEHINAATEIDVVADTDVVPTMDASNGGALRKSPFSKIYDYIKSILDGAVTLAGAKTFTGQLELTGQSAIDDDSAMTGGTIGQLRRYNKHIILNNFTGATSVSGGGGAPTASILQISANSSSTPGNYHTYLPGIFTNITPNIDRQTIDFTRKIKITWDVIVVLSSSSNSESRYIYPVASTYTNGRLSRKGFGFIVIGQNVYGCAHDGTTHYLTTASFASGANKTATLHLESDGSGNVSFYVNGALLETITTGPTGTDTIINPRIGFNVECGADGLSQWFFCDQVELLSQ